MRGRMSGGAFDKRQSSRPRSRSRPRMSHFVSLHSVDETFDKPGLYPYYQCPSPIKSDGAGYLFGRSPSPPTIIRRSDYHKGSNVAATLSSLPKGAANDYEYYPESVERSYRDIEGDNTLGLRKQVPVRGSSRPSDYEYYPEPYDRRGDEHTKIPERRIRNSRYTHDLVDKGKDLVGGSNVETKPLSRGYSHHLVGQGRESRRVEDGPSPSSGRKYEELRVYDAVSNGHPVRPCFHPTRNQTITRNTWDSDGYDSGADIYDTDCIEHLQNPKEVIEEESFYKQDFERDVSFRNGAATFQTSPSLKAPDSKKNDIAKHSVERKRLLPYPDRKSNWNSDASLMSKNIDSNSKEPLKNIGEDWMNPKPGRMFFQDQEMSEVKGASNEYNDAKIDNINLSLSRAPHKIDFGVSYVHDRAIKGRNKNPKKDIKKRLGGRASVKTRLGPLRNVKQRLGPIPVIVKPRILAPKILKISPLEHIKPSHATKTEPPEDSESFKHMTNGAFLKFSKSLNENAGNRRKFLDKGDSGTFSCSVCGSSSEFVGTTSLAQHAYQSCKVGLRSEHLGFHRALCVMMGWKPPEGMKAFWNVQKLSESESESAQNDLLIWPPVVFIHAKMGVNPKEVRDVLQANEIGESMANLSQRKGPNGTLFVVGFKGTLPGYTDALKLHNYFAQSEHGRSKYLQSTSTAIVWLYGYMGIAGDLDKLDFEMKKKCCLKSRTDVDSYAA